MEFVIKKDIDDGKKYKSKNVSFKNSDGKVYV